MTSPKWTARSTNCGDMPRANIRVKACWLKTMARYSISKLYPRSQWPYAMHGDAVSLRYYSTSHHENLKFGIINL